MSSLGFTPEDYAAPVEVWPENWPAWCLWNEVRGQWRMGTAGPIALDYGPLFDRMDRMRLADPEWEHLFQDIRVIEAAALDAMRKT